MGGSSASIRDQVAESWYRSAAAGVDANCAVAPITLLGDTLRDYRAAHPLATVFPLLDEVLGETARACESVMAVSDAQGQLLWICGDSGVRGRAESIGFVEGSNWDERLAGTNAPGMALSLDQPAQVLGSEHFRRTVRPWSCVATPIHDPHDSSILGVLDVTGGTDAIGPQTLAMVRATARMAESELARDLLERSIASQPPAPMTRTRLRLRCLGRTEALLTVAPAGKVKPETVRLSPRHSEIMLLLAATRPGLTGVELATELYEDDVISSTLRAEITRLRSLLGEDLLESRPYRLAADVTSDWLNVQAQLVAGDVSAALRAYRGPVLPRSVAPGISRIREDVHSDLRQAVLRSGHPELMSQWTRSTWGADDYQMWQEQAQELSRNSPLLPMVQGQIHRLDNRFGTTTPGSAQ